MEPQWLVICRTLNHPCLAVNHLTHTRLVCQPSAPKVRKVKHQKKQLTRFSWKHPLCASWWKQTKPYTPTNATLWHVRLSSFQNDHKKLGERPPFLEIPCGICGIEECRPVATPRWGGPESNCGDPREVLCPSRAQWPTLGPAESWNPPNGTMNYS